MYQLYFYVPETHLDKVKQAVFGAGAGKIGNYDQCCFQIKGQGQYRPLTGSQPFLGKQGQLNEVAEYKVEMVCDKSLRGVIEQALLGAHPYEVVAYGFIALDT